MPRSRLISSGRKRWSPNRASTRWLAVRGASGTETAVQRPRPGSSTARERDVPTTASSSGGAAPGSPTTRAA